VHPNCVFAVNTLYLTDQQDALELRRKLWYFFFNNLLVFNNSQDLDGFIEKACDKEYTNDALALDSHDPDGGTTLFNCLYSAKVMGDLRNKQQDCYMAQPTLVEMQSTKYLKMTKEGKLFLEMKVNMEYLDEITQHEKVIIEKQKELEFLTNKLNDNYMDTQKTQEYKQKLNTELQSIQK